MDAATRELNVSPELFEPISTGAMSFLPRLDRGFKVGDIVRLREYDLSSDGIYSGREVHRRIKYVLGGEGSSASQRSGIWPGYVVLELLRPEDEL